MNKHEIVMNALFEKLKQIENVPIYKNEPLPQKIPDTGAIFLRDGTVSEAEILLSPPRTVSNHIAEVEVVCQTVSANDRDVNVDELIGKVNAVLSEDVTLSGAVDYCATQTPEYILEAPEGGIPIKGAIIPVFLEYLT